MIWNLRNIVAFIDKNVKKIWLQNQNICHSDLVSAYHGTRVDACFIYEVASIKAVTIDIHVKTNKATTS